MKQSKPFEKFIKFMLKQADGADELRDLSQNLPDNSLHDALNDLFGDSEGIENDFLDSKYTPKQKVNVLKKINTLMESITESEMEMDEEDVAKLKIILSKVRTGYKMGDKIKIYLNDLHRKYK